MVVCYMKALLPPVSPFSLWKEPVGQMAHPALPQSRFIPCKRGRKKPLHSSFPKGRNCMKSRDRIQLLFNNPSLMQLLVSNRLGSPVPFSWWMSAAQKKVFIDAVHCWWTNGFFQWGLKWMWTFSGSPDAGHRREVERRPSSLSSALLIWH